MATQVSELSVDELRILIREVVRATIEDMFRLSQENAQRILTKIRWLAENFDAIRPEQLTGQWAGAYKLRVGDYRVLYTHGTAVGELVIHLFRHRREVYRI